MLALSDLVNIVADLTGVPEATVFAYGRFAREAGFISQTGRAKKTAMTVRDISNLLIAMCGTEVTREAGKAVEFYRLLPPHTLGPDFPARDWRDEFSNLCLTGGTAVATETFGEFFDRMVRWSINGKLKGVLDNIDSVLLLPETQQRFEKRLSDPSASSKDKEITQRYLESAGKRGPVFIEFKFNRTGRTVAGRIFRYWDDLEVYDGVDFWPPTHHLTGTARYLRDFHVSASLSSVTLELLGAKLNELGLSVDFN